MRSLWRPLITITTIITARSSRCRWSWIARRKTRAGLTAIPIPALSAHEHGEHTHQHFHEHDTGWQSFVLRCEEPQDAAKIKAASA